MKEFKLNNDTYFLPQSWEDVKINQWAEIQTINEDEELTQTEKTTKIVSVLTHLPHETILEAGIMLVTKLWNELSFALTPPEVKEMAYVSVNGVNYYAKTLDKTGEFVAFNKITSVFTDDNSQKISYILALMLRKQVQIPVISKVKTGFKRFFTRKQEQNKIKLELESFNLEPEYLENRAKMFGSCLNVVQVLSLAAFFLTNSKLYKLNLKLYSQNQSIQLKLRENLISISEISTDGKPVFSIMKRILLNMMRYYNKMLGVS